MLIAAVDGIPAIRMVARYVTRIPSHRDGIRSLDRKQMKRRIARVHAPLVFWYRLSNEPMSALSIQVFVSYCREDVDPDDPRLRAFVDALKDPATHDAAIVVGETPTMEAVAETPGATLGDAQVVVTLLTPRYQAQAALSTPAGVTLEFRQIVERQLRHEARAAREAFMLLPIIWAGTFEESCPPELSHLHCIDLRWLLVAGRSLHPTVKTRFTAAIADIKAQIRAVSYGASRLINEERETLFQSFLFHDTKSRWDKPENERYLQSAFVKTRTFLRVQNHEVKFLVGRKGAGKSTITHVLPLLARPRPKQVLRIDFEQLPIELCFNVLTSHPAEASDLRHAFSPIYSYELLWDAFLHLFLAWQSRRDLPAKASLASLFRSIAAGTSSCDDLEQNATVTRALFVHTFEELIAFVDVIMREKGSQSLARAVAAFTIPRFRARVFGNTWPAIVTILRSLRRTSGRVLVTVDGFDVRVDYFARAAADRDAAVRFESELLLSLFQTAFKSQSSTSEHDAFFQVADLCIAIPHDRFMQVRALDRDSYRYRHSVSNLSWSGIELAALIRKRLALLRKVPDAKGATLDVRLSEVMKAYPELPDELSFKFGSAHYRLPLFTYVLRHTFWRPRDVLFFYAALLAASNYARKRNEQISTAFVRQVISGAARSVIEDEFIAEYANVFRNLRDVLFTFRKAPQIMSWQRIAECLNDIRFEVTMPAGERVSPEWKVEVLYEIGVLGAVLNKRDAERLTTFRHAFVFNEGSFLKEKLGRDLYHSISFAVHPVFVEYLHLDTTSNAELVLPLDWEYLRTNEDLRSSIPSSYDGQLG